MCAPHVPRVRNERDHDKCHDGWRENGRNTQEFCQQIFIVRIKVTLSSFNPLTFLNALITYKPTFLHPAPPLLVFLTTHQGVKPHHLESLRYILVGAAPVQPSLIREFKEKAPHVELREGWGMSEVFRTSQV